MDASIVALAVYLGIGVILFVWFQIQQTNTMENAADGFLWILLSNKLIQVVLIPLWPLWLCIVWFMKQQRDEGGRK